MKLKLYIFRVFSSFFHLVNSGLYFIDLKVDKYFFNTQYFSLIDLIRFWSQIWCIELIFFIWTFHSTGSTLILMAMLKVILLPAAYITLVSFISMVYFSSTFFLTWTSTESGMLTLTFWDSYNEEVGTPDSMIWSYLWACAPLALFCWYEW